MTGKVFRHNPQGYAEAYDYAKKTGGILSRDRRGYVVDPIGSVLSEDRGERYFITSFREFTFTTINGSQTISQRLADGRWELMTTGYPMERWGINADALKQRIEALGKRADGTYIIKVPW